MQRPVKVLLVLSLLGGVLVATPSGQARDHGGSHGGGGGGPIIFIPPSGGGGGDHIRNGGIDSYIRHGDGISGSIGRRQSSPEEFSRPSHSQEFIYRKRHDGDYISRPSVSQEPIYRKRQGFEEKKRDGKYSDISKWRRHDDFDHHKHKRYRYRHGKYQHYYAGWWYLDPWWTYGLEPYFYLSRLSCAEARRIVRQRYNRVRTIECRGRIYTFTAMDKRGRIIEVSVNSVTGAYWQS
jgi:hypothetical protein